MRYFVGGRSLRVRLGRGDCFEPEGAPLRNRRTSRCRRVGDEGRRAGARFVGHESILNTPANDGSVPKACAGRRLESAGSGRASVQLQPAARESVTFSHAMMERGIWLETTE